MKKFFAFTYAIVALVLALGVPPTADAEYLPTKEQVAMATLLLPQLAVTGEGWRALMIGESHRPGIVAYAAVSTDGTPAWGLEEWSLLENGNLQKVQWRFYQGIADRQEQEFELGTRILLRESPRVEFPTTDPDVVKASEKCWRELMRVGHPT